MLDELLKLVSSESSEQIINNPKIPNEQNETAVQTATDSIFDSLKGQVSSGNGADVLSLLGGKTNVQGNPLVGNLVDNVTNSLMNKLGIASPIAKQVAASLVPVVIGKLVNQTNDPNDNGFSLNSIFGALTDGRSDKFNLENFAGNPETGQKEQGMDLSGIFNLLAGK